MRRRKRTCGESNVLAFPFCTRATYFRRRNGSTLVNTPAGGSRGKGIAQRLAISERPSQADFMKPGGKVDSVNVAVPDHMHFSIAYSAIQKGKHVYCQKPLCHDVAEVRMLTQAAVRAGVITQLGTQVASTVHERTAVLWLREGRI